MFITVAMPRETPARRCLLLNGFYVVLICVFWLRICHDLSTSPPIIMWTHVHWRFAPLVRLIWLTNNAPSINFLWRPWADRDSQTVPLQMAERSRRPRHNLLSNYGIRARGRRGNVKHLLFTLHNGPCWRSLQDRKQSAMRPNFIDGVFISPDSVTWLFLRGTALRANYSFSCSDKIFRRWL